MDQRERMFNLPATIVWLSGALFAIQLVRGFLPYASDVGLLMTFGFIPARYGEVAASLPGGEGAMIWTPLTYAFLHADWMHVGVNVMWMVAFGSAVARRFGSARFLGFFAVTAVAGAAAQYLAMPADQTLVIGASASVSGLTAAVARFAFVPGGPLAGGRGREEGFFVPDPGLKASLLNPYSAFFIGIWFAINLLFGLQSGLVPGAEGQIAWQAHIGGFVAGLVLFPLFDPVAPARRI
ncbi:rhomboid family intramembrane serine protease [Afifella sp. IM 167]|uniref:rhomboid family intramembrane serine protease n=1 Tax=Afifella sp. IM 167 TaxID=2033586 RepID=UPI001CCD288C|nr:rhomboid family intramembrane serine protease [Afifella sp. IM 167]MBZ8134628.1 rhomboid family intramembrane serine protease [Afifella sp. IM 167]